MRTSSHPKGSGMERTGAPADPAQTDPGFPIEGTGGGQGTGGGNAAKPPGQATMEGSSSGAGQRKRRKTPKRGTPARTPRARRSG